MDLVLFTLTFPYGTSEPFLEQEVPVLARHFDHVFIVPAGEHHLPLRNLPENAAVVDLRKGQKTKPALTDLLVTLPLWLPVYLWSMFRPGCFATYMKYYKSFIHYAWQDLQSYRKLKQFIESQDLSGALFYDYWFVNSLLSLSKLKEAGVIRKIICRVHGFDLYDNRQYEGMVSFREFKVRHADRIFAISRHGMEYLKAKADTRYSAKIVLSYLGVASEQEVGHGEYAKDRYLVVSCSNLLPFKRVEHIAEFLEATDLPVHWVHFGDGPSRTNLDRVLERTNNSGMFTWELKGAVQNQIILDFYRSYRVDLFINLSLTEGLPVSIMEALSFGIPVIAPNTNGVPELVNEETGILVDVNLNSIEIASSIKEILTGKRFDKQRIRTFALKNFSAENNYSKFAKII